MGPGGITKLMQGHVEQCETLVAGIVSIFYPIQGGYVNFSHQIPEDVYML